MLLGKQLYKDLKEKGSTEIKVSDSFYSCLDCFACIHVCPAGVNAGEVSDIAKQIITQKGSPLEDQQKNVARMIVSATMKYGNPLGLRKQAAKWARGLDFDAESDTIMFTGNMYQLMPHSSSMASMRIRAGEKLSEGLAGLMAKYPQILRFSGLLSDRKTEGEMNSALLSIYELLRKSGVSFNYLGKEEPYPGTFIYDLGYTNEFAEYAKRVTSLLKSRGVKRIITTDPHSHNMFCNKYPEYVENFDIEVVYYLDLIDTKLFNSDEEEVVFHEPCYFALRDPVYNKPNEILARTSKVSLPRRSGKSDHCCGGPSELLYPKIAHGVSEKRREQLESGKGKKTITACPICYANLERDSDVTDIANHLKNRLKA